MSCQNNLASHVEYTFCGKLLHRKCSNEKSYPQDKEERALDFCPGFA